ncbi:MAG: hypothetical protein NUV57_05595 [archaeon]|nr:hypothetical protein [archaeon]
MFRKKTELTKRQQRILDHKNLWPLTPLKEVSERFEIPMSVLDLIERPNPKNIETAMGLIQKFRKNPETEWIIYARPKLWRLQRIIELAPQHSTEEIRKILLGEAEEKNRQKAGGRNKNPSFSPIAYNAINAIIKKFNLRTEEQTAKITRQVQRRRPENKLTQTEKSALMTAAAELVKKSNYFRTTPMISAEDLRQTVLEKLLSEVNYFNPRKYGSLEELTEQWLNFLKKTRIIPFRIRDVLREIGPTTRKGNPRLALVQAENIYNFPDTKMPRLGLEQRRKSSEIKFKVPLTETEKAILELLAEGVSRKEIANRRGTNLPAVSIAIRKIKDKVA